MAALQRQAPAPHTALAVSSHRFPPSPRADCLFESYDVNRDGVVEEVEISRRNQRQDATSSLTEGMPESLVREVLHTHAVHSPAHSAQEDVDDFLEHKVGGVAGQEGEGQ